jgi:hypothetical protein
MKFVDFPSDTRTFEAFDPTERRWVEVVVRPGWGNEVKHVPGYPDLLMSVGGGLLFREAKEKNDE